MDILDVLISLKNSYSSIVNPDVNVGCIVRIYMEELENKLEIRLKICKSKSNSIINRMFENNTDEITFFDALGIGEEFKWLFDGLLCISTFSKKYVSNFIRNEIVYNYTDYRNTVFSFYISLNDIEMQV